MREDNIGIGVLLSRLIGNETTMAALKESLGKRIESVKIENNELNMQFVEDEKGISFFDDGQSCCERRWMHTDDDLDYYAGALFLDVEVAEGSIAENKYGDPTESQFLNVTTSKGVFTVVNYNEHNGYYGGFVLKADFINP